MKQRLLSLLLIACLVFGLVPMTAAAEENASFVYNETYDILILKNFSGSLTGEQLQQLQNAAMVLAEGINTVSGPVQSEKLNLFVLAGGSLSFDSAVAVEHVMLTVGKESELTISGLCADQLYTAGPGEIQIQSSGIALQVSGMSVLQHNGVLTLQGEEKAAVFGEVILPPSNRIFLSPTKNNPSDAYDGGPYLRIQPHSAISKLQRQQIKDEETQEEIPVVVFEAPEAAAAEAEVAMLACYDAEGKMLGMTEGRCTGGQWSFEDPGYDGEWRVFFSEGSLVPQCQFYTVETAAEPEAVLCAEPMPVMLAEEPVAADHTLAIGLVSALGVIRPYEDGTFLPENSMTRAEAAKIAANLMNAGADVSDLYADACTLEDVKKDQWFAKEAGYCQQTGLISHMIRNNRYDPFGRTELLDFAGMLLVVLGYDADSMGFWDKERIRREAEELGLLEGIPNAEWDGFLKRGQAAQMIVNALHCSVVVGSLVQFNELAEQMPATGEECLLALQENPFPLLICNGTYKTRLDRYGRLVILLDDPLYEALYNGRLHYSERCDPWGRPGISWTLYDGSIMVYSGAVQTQPMVLSKTEAVDLGQALSAQIAAGYGAKLYIDGREDAEQTLLTEDIAQQWSEHTGNGIVTEVYADDTAKSVTVVIRNSWLAQVTSLGGDTVTLTDMDGNPLDVITRRDCHMDEWFLLQRCGDDSLALQPVELRTGVVGRIAAHGEDLVVQFVGETEEFKPHSGCVERIREHQEELVGQELLYWQDPYGYLLTVIPKPETKTMLFLKESLQMVKDETDVDGTVCRYSVDAVAFASNPLPETVALKETAYQALQGYPDRSLLSVTVSEPAAVIDAAQSGTALVSAGRVVEVNGAAFVMTSDTQILTQTENEHTGKTEYHYYDGKDELDWTQADNCPCQYLNEGGKLTYVFFDLAAAADPAEYVGFFVPGSEREYTNDAFGSANPNGFEAECYDLTSDETGSIEIGSIDMEIYRAMQDGTYLIGYTKQSDLAVLERGAQQGELQITDGFVMIDGRRVREADCVVCVFRPDLEKWNVKRVQPEELEAVLAEYGRIEPVQYLSSAEGEISHLAVICR